MDGDSIPYLENIRTVFSKYIFADSGNEDEEKEDGLLLRISLEYDGDGRRPKQGCIRIKVSGTHKDR